MAEKVKGFVVTLQNDISKSNAEAVAQLLTHIQGVISVDPIEGDFKDIIIQQRIAHEVREKLYKIIEEL
jgi:hypothetical protein